mmetsp:Transcript_7836/g.30946  ORF Transcript_7836/g.30946 Transcript_7836/m.30946 type:complete len:1024 (-) Transcript_7836:191-3262(-)
MSGDGWGGGWGDLSSTEGWAAPESGEHEDAAPWPVAAPEQGAPAAAPCAGEPGDNDSDAGVGNLATPETLARLASSASDADEEVAAAPDEQSPGQQEARPAHDSGWGWSSDPAPDSGASADAGSGAAALSAAQAAGPDPSAGFGTPQEAPVPAWGASLLAEAETARSGGAAAAASGAGEAAAAAPDLHAPAPAALLPQASAVSLSSDRDGWEGPSVAAAGELHAALREAASRSRVKFNDTAFPPDASSLGDLRPIAEEGVPDLPPPRVEWLRARAVGREDAADASRSGGWTVAGAGAGAAPGFPVQGALGDCYIISALAVALSARRFAAGLSPGLVEASLRFGIARCRLCIGGAWSDVITDDFLPCRPGSHDPVFASARGAQLWPAYVEKALAKCFGSYGALAGGRTNEALCWLTGAPLTCVDPVLNRTAEEADVAGVAELVASNAARYGASATLPPDAHLLPVSPGSDDDTFWDRLCRYAANGYLMGASCGASGPVSDLSAWAAAGLVFNHAYSVLGVRQLAGGQRLVRLRNPWAGSESTLAWGPRWPGWTAELRAELGEGPAGDAGPAHGRFWIALSDFRRLFNGLDVCEVRPGWRVTRSVALAPSSAEGLQGTGYFPAFEITVPSGATGEDAGAGAGWGAAGPDGGREGESSGSREGFSPDRVRSCITLWQAEPRQRAARAARGLIHEDERDSDDWRVPPPDATPGALGLGPDRRRPQKRMHVLSLTLLSCAAAKPATPEAAAATACSAASEAAHDWHGAEASGREPPPRSWPHPLLGEAAGFGEDAASRPRMLAATTALAASSRFVHAALRPGRRYLAVPLALSTAFPGSTRWTEVLCSVHAEAPGATVRRVAIPCSDVAKTMFERARTMAVRRQLLAALPEDEGIRDAGVFLWKMLDGPAVTYLLENRTRRRTVTVQTIISNGKNIILSRAATAEAAVQFAGKRSSKTTAKFTDTLLPLTRMVVVSCSPQRTPSVNRSVDTSVSWMDPPPEVRVGSGTTPASHDPAAVGFHAPIQCEA